MNIRIANSSDKHRIAELFKEMVEFHSQKDTSFTLKATGHEYYAVWFNEQIENDFALPMVAESDGMIVGFSLSFLWKYPTTWLSENYGEINVDNKACFRYLESYWFGLIDASICCAALSCRSSESEVGLVAAWL